MALVFGGKEVVFKPHAIDRLIERFTGAGKPQTREEWMGLAENLLIGSEEDPVNKVDRVKRTINNRFQEARYFYNKEHDLRFVIVEEENFFVVVTVEKPRKRVSRGLVSSKLKRRSRREQRLQRRLSDNPYRAQNIRARKRNWA